MQDRSAKSGSILSLCIEGTHSAPLKRAFVKTVNSLPHRIIWRETTNLRNARNGGSSMQISQVIVV
jgi:hypothetical protein